ncbi:hypothetical protein CBLAS_0016 [Campylobacter blaseri]|uniref:Uncharacterized protein n=1 Tax=Campylobacter blaseri TaxID=2042961 RepID=A0A2P8R3I0_9BACT|nr:hypothetical protein [Campylobacter blaseri]PSM53052.1 hypothetical protein CQ405_00410 [Campylobacter blaseri]PSM54519.1 hypothetical protein CRN67_00410 [Campylobacter blaseri]QKF85234.1 hypothetical protein CBLAS_0016 [Campylobacter blaseri]
MATIMEKDVLLEYASIGHLLPKDRTQEIMQDFEKMCNLRREILETEYKDIDYNKMLKEIKKIRDKYDRA